VHPPNARRRNLDEYPVRLLTPFLFPRQRRGPALPRGLIVGSAVIEKVTPGEHLYEWHLTGVERLDRPRKPTGHPQPVWFRPF
jgi:hypothetical protein